MNTTFLFDNMIIFPLCAVVVIATYLIQFCSCISPCRIEFDEDSRREMRLMNRYNVLSENAYTIYISAILSGIVAAIFMASVILLIVVMIMQLTYLTLALAIMIAMYNRNRQYWDSYEKGEFDFDMSRKIPSREALTISGTPIYN